MTVSYAVSDGIAEILIDNPPVNALSESVRVDIVALLDRFERDETAQALLIRCAGRTFVAGADIKEFDKPKVAEPTWPVVMRRFDFVTKPIVAALHGTVLGGGLELALACHWRIAAPGTRFGFPEVKLGILPGAGGTQRAPRVAGLKTAIALVTEGKTIGVDEALAAGLVDEIAGKPLPFRGGVGVGTSAFGGGAEVPTPTPPQGEGLLGAAREFARRILAEGRGVRIAGELPMPADDPALFEEARKSLAKKMRGQKAPLVALEAIRAGYDHDFEGALAEEYRLCRELMAGEQSQALRHNFLAERAVAHVPGLPEGTVPRPIGVAGVVGVGGMGRGIAMSIVTAGVPVIAVAKDEAHRGAAEKAIAKLWGSSVAKGSLTQEEMDRRTAAIRWSTDLADLAEAELVIEAASEDMAVKRALFAELGRVTRPGTILASNTSYLDIDALGEASGRPADVCGMHFFTPAHVMRLLENVRGRETAADVVATIMAFGKRIGKLPILSGVCEGFIVNRMLAKRSREAYFLIEEGACPEAIDRVLTGFGFPMGALALGDLAGLDLQAAARKTRWASLTERERRADFVEQMAAAGRLGQKSGAGWYRYGEDRKPGPNPGTAEMVAAHAARHALTLREVSDDEIRERLLYAMVNEGAKLLAEGVAPRPEEIDVAMVNGIGWPAVTGGPMWWADRIGLAKVLASIERFRGDQGDEYWTPAPLLVERAGAGRGFYG